MEASKGASNVIVDVDTIDRECGDDSSYVRHFFFGHVMHTDMYNVQMHTSTIELSCFKENRTLPTSHGYAMFEYVHIHYFLQMALLLIFVMHLEF
mmetsp:Transcript_25081/g.38802  ORF Transcript_25081/g.38802 Transcript_25081/m.38802 type:complete len:95 (-) Transcript_25081:687-971(-)